MLRGDANENSQKNKKLLRSDTAHFLFCFLSCLKTIEKKTVQKQDGNTTQIHEIKLIQNHRKLS